MAIASQRPVSNTFVSNAGDLTNESFLDYIDTVRKTNDPVVRKTLVCNELGASSFCNFLEAYADVEYSNLTTWQLLRYFQPDYKIVLSNTAAITIAPLATGVLPINTLSGIYQNGNGNISAEIGESVLLPNDYIAVITAKNTGVGSPSITILNKSSVTITLDPFAEVILVPGKSLAGCECPQGKVRLMSEPMLEQIGMIKIGDAFKLCGDDLEEKKMRKFTYKVFDKDGIAQDVTTYVSEALIEKLKAFELGKILKMYFGVDAATGYKGIIPQLKDKAIRWDWADPNVLTDLDLDVLSDELNEKGFDCREFSFTLGQRKYDAVQKYIQTKAVGKVSFGCFSPEDLCRTLSLDFCCIERNGLKLCFMLEKCFSNGKLLGAKAFKFPYRGLGMPMENREKRGTDRDLENDNYKAISFVYFRSVQGTTYDLDIESSGKHGKIKNHEAGCTDTKYSMVSRFAVEVHCPYCWILLGNWD